MNLIHLMNYAWKQRQDKGKDALVIESRNLISHAYAKMISYNENIFYAFQTVYVFIMLADGDFLQGEYDAYVKFCELAGYQCLTVDECKSFYKRKTTSDLAESIRTIKNYRYNVSANNYEAMIVAFCYLCLLGDKAMDENEYYIIRCFFDESEDYCPSDWATFKREW